MDPRRLAGVGLGVAVTLFLLSAALPAAGAHVLAAPTGPTERDGTGLQTTSCDQHPTFRDDRCESWVGYYDNPGGHDPQWHMSEEPTAATIDPARGRIFVTGMSFDHESESVDFATAAFSSRGDQLWAKRLSGPVTTADHPTALALSEDGSVLYVTGGIGGDGTGRWRPLTIAYRARDGAELWRVVDPRLTRKRFDPSWIGTSEKSVFVSGSVKDPSGGHDVYLVRYDLKGHQEWVARHSVSDEGADRPTSIATTDDGRRLFLGGSTEIEKPSGSVDGAFAMAVDGTDGSLLWKVKGGSLGGLVAVTDLALNGSGSKVLLTGSIRSSSGTGGASVLALSARTGAQLWSRSFPFTRLELEPLRAAPELEVLDNNVVVAASGSDEESRLYFATTAFDVRSGKSRWTSVASEGVATSMASLSNERGPGRVVIGGWFKPGSITPLQPNGRIDCFTSVQDPKDGAILWQARFESEAAIRGSNCSRNLQEESTFVLASPEGTFLVGLKEHGNVDGITPPYEGNTFDYMVLGYLWGEAV